MKCGHSPRVRARGRGGRGDPAEEGPPPSLQLKSAVLTTLQSEGSRVSMQGDPVHLE